MFDAPIPDFDKLAVQAKYTILHGKSHSPEEKQTWQQIEEVIKQFTSADKYVLAIPMWNFSIPYRLKQYIDILVQPGYTFSYSPETGYKGLVHHKPLLAVYARGGQYETSTEAQAFDLQKKYIELIFGFIGFESVNSIIVEPTLQAGPDITAEKVRNAVETAKKLATEF